MHKRIAFLGLILVLVLLSGCASGNSAVYTADKSAAQEDSAAIEYPADSEGWYGEEESSEATSDTSSRNYGGHKVIMTASLGLETRAFDEDLAVLKQKAETLGGYVANSDISGKKPESYGDSGRNASLTFRIPKEQFDAFLESASGVATVTYRSTGSDDVTDSYFDTQSRLEIYQTQRDRTLALLEKADKMEDIIALETELSRLTYEIESLTTQLKKWDDLIDFSTVTISLTEIPAATAASGEESIGSRMKEGFVHTLGGMSVFFENLLILFVAASPVLILLAVLALAIVLIVRLALRRQSKKQKKNPYPVSTYQPQIPTAPESVKSEKQK